MIVEVVGSHVVRITDDDGSEITVKAAANGGLRCIGRIVPANRLRGIPKAQFVRMMSCAGEEFARLRRQQLRVVKRRKRA